MERKRAVVRRVNFILAIEMCLFGWRDVETEGFKGSVIDCLVEWDDCMQDPGSMRVLYMC